MAKKGKKKDTFKRLRAGLLVLLILAVVCWASVEWINAYRRSALADRIREVNETNEEYKLLYQVERAEYERATRTGEGRTWPPAPAEGISLLDLSTYPMENTSAVTVSRQDLLEGGLMLVNHWHGLPADFSEQNVISVRDVTNNFVPVRDNKIKLFRAASEAIEAMLLDAHSENLKDYIIQNAFRTMDEQRDLFEKQAGSIRAKNPNMIESLVVEQAIKSVNFPGTSEYQTGFSFEMKLYNKNDVTITGMRFPDSDQGKWVNENCWKYGILFRFPAAGYPSPGTEDKSFITGNASKLNIYRYVGVAHSTAMKIMNMCLEEYIDYLVANPHFAIFENGQLRYEVFRQPYSGGDAVIQVPHAASRYTASIDNLGGVVTAYYYD
ncbi:MAG: D-alanyl-D-alanine carboxypeptidase family protein [Clostridia bacterium]|nr:D-alanyl-D-alanine carboxypeptidase family protein [Clostridia bacterium]